MYKITSIYRPNLPHCCHWKNNPRANDGRRDESVCFHRAPELERRVLAEIPPTGRMHSVIDRRLAVAIGRYSTIEYANFTEQTSNIVAEQILGWVYALLM